jgi:hypothetical protein
MSNKKYYVYALIDPETYTPFYIGKGSGSRLKTHLAEAHGSKKRWVNNLKCHKILSVESKGNNVKIKKLFTQLTEVQAFQVERNEISKWGKIIDGTGCLTNIDDGGAGGGGCPKSVVCYSPEGKRVREFVSLEEGAIFAGIHKSTVCAALNKRTKLAGGYRWAYENEEVDLTSMKNISPVTMYDLHGNVIKEYDKLSEAADELDMWFTTIVDCCKRKHETAGGYRWAYRGQTLLPLRRPVEFYLSKKYQALDKNNNVVGTFNTLKDAVEHTTANSTGIVDCCAGRTQSSGGLKWKYVFD